MMNRRLFSVFLALSLGVTTGWQQVRSEVAAITASLPAKATITLNNNDKLKGVTLKEFNKDKKQIVYEQGNSPKTLAIADIKQVRLHGETRIDGSSGIVIVLMGEGDGKCGSEMPLSRRLAHLQWGTQRVVIDLSDYDGLITQPNLSFVLTKLEFADGDLQRLSMKQ